jgi:dTDP-glucose 4,6-dehydratase
MRTLLITGGAGFIGGCLTRKLIGERTARVVNLDKLTYAGNLDSLASIADDSAYVFVQGDIGDRLLVNDLLARFQPDAVINVAAETHVDRSIDRPSAFINTNVVGVFELLQASLQFWQTLDSTHRARFRFLQVSTDEVYGSLGAAGKFTESTAYAPNSPYSASKAAADHLVRSYHHTYGLPVLTTNCSNNYGPFQFPEKLFPLMILNALEGKPLPVYGDGQNVRDWLYVEDHVQGLLTVLENGPPGEVYNIGGNCERTNLDVVSAICSAVDELRPDLPHSPTSSLIRFVPDRPGHDRRYAIDAGKIQRELGWVPRQSFESGVCQTVQWYLDNRSWVERISSGVYRRERLGLMQDALT